MAPLEIDIYTIFKNFSNYLSTIALVQLQRVSQPGKRA
jgi:hypothetical protein